MIEVQTRIRDMERIGSGIRRMRELMRQAGLKEPVFESDTFFRAIFLRNPDFALKQAPETGRQTTQKTVEKTVEKILELIRVNPNVTQEELKNKTGLTRRGIEWNINKLKRTGIIRRI